MKVKRFLILGLDALLAVLLLTAKPLVSLAMDILPTCPFLRAGYLCPACGGTRCIFSIMGLDFAKAFGFNPFIFIMFFYFLAVLLAVNLHLLFNLKIFEKIYKVMLSPPIIITIAFLFLGFGILRNFI